MGLSRPAPLTTNPMAIDARFHLLAAAAYQDLVAGGTVLEADGHGDKLIALRDGRYLKLFRRKRLFSSALMWPYARRFHANAGALRERGVRTVATERLLRIPHIRRTAVIYRPLPGETLRTCLRKAADRGTLLRELGSFLATLHRRGVYFRSLHFGNLIVSGNGEFGLIDVADLELRNRPLRPHQILRNLCHLMRYAEDWALVQGGAHEFCGGYAEAGGVLPAPLVAQLAAAVSGGFPAAADPGTCADTTSG
jgi:tRNA A-37 threonylcarbamoyl transferase component Bud32